MMQILTMCFVNMSPFVYDMKKGDCLIYMKIEKSDRVIVMMQSFKIKLTCLTIIRVMLDEV